MEDIVQFKGINTAPNEMISGDGETTILNNAEIRDGAVIAARLDGVALTVTGEDDFTALYIHNMKGKQKNFIFKDGSGVLKFAKINNDNTTGAAIEIEDVPAEITSGYQKINSIGNTLIIITDSDVHYFLFSDARYKYLGTSLPDIDLSFGLVAGERYWDYDGNNEDNFFVQDLKKLDSDGNTDEDTEYLEYCKDDCANADWMNAAVDSQGTTFKDYLKEHSYDSGMWYPTSIKKDFIESKSTAVTNAILAGVNTFIREEIDRKGFFIYPFFVRYALKLYDGTYTKQSPPILMIPCSGATPLVYRADRDARGQIKALASVLNYKLVAASEDYERWSDIVKGITIFVSSPIYTIDISGKVERPEIYGEYARLNSNADGGGTPTGKSSNPRFGVFRLVGKGEIDEVEKDNAGDEDNYGFNEYIPALRNYGNRQNIYRQSDKKLQDFVSYYAETIFNTGSAPNVDLPYHLWYLIGYELPKPEKSIEERITDYSHFYKLCDVDLDALVTERTKVDIPDGQLVGIETREQLPDDYDSHRPTSFGDSYIYNSRMNVYNVRQKIFGGFRPKVSFPNATIATKPQYEDCSNRGESNESYSLVMDNKVTLKLENIQLYVKLKKDGDTYVVKAKNTDPNFNYGLLYFYYYPDPDAYELDIFYTYSREPISGGVQIRTVTPCLAKFNLKPHPNLNGAYYCDLNVKDFTAGEYHDTTIKQNEQGTPVTGNENDNGAFVGTSDGQYYISAAKEELDNAVESGNKWIEYPQKILTTSLNNPFVFPLESRITFSAEKIIGIAANTEPVSTGQFGQYPLLVLTDSGVFAVSVDSDGSYASVPPPISREVCSNADSIVQTGNSVLFVSNTGLMEISGGSVRCISNAINEMCITPEFLTEGLKDLVINDAVGFMQDAFAAFDYQNRRVLLIEKENAETQRLLSYSIGEKQWSTLSRNIGEFVKYPVISDYPHIYMTCGNSFNKIIRSTSIPPHSDKGTVVSILSRPFKLNNLDFKTIKELMYIGVLSYNPTTSLFGSRDGITYEKIGSSVKQRLGLMTGKSYKFFKQLITLKMKSGDSLSGIRFKFDKRYTNRYR